MGLLLCSEDGSLCLTLTDSVVEKISRLAKERAPFETGGVLLGYIDSGLRHATAVEASDPPGDSQHGRIFFFRGTKGIDKLLAWGLKQDPALVYLGEWHSHPSGSAYPSSPDITQLKEFSGKKAFGASTPAMVIIGGKSIGKSMWKAAVIDENKKVIYLSIF